MLIVTEGKVDGVARGGILDGLTAEREKYLISLGVAEKITKKEAAAAIADADDAKPETAAKGPSASELKARCKELGLPATGSKADMEARIAEAEAALDGADDAGDDADDEEPPALNAEVPQ